MIFGVVALYRLPVERYPPITPPTVQVSDEGSSSPRHVGMVICITGAALIISGLISLGLASRDAAKLTPNQSRYLPAEQVGLYQAAKTKELAGGVLLGVGAAAALGGGALWLIARQGASVELSIAPGPGGAVARLGGTF